MANQTDHAVQFFNEMLLQNGHIRPTYAQLTAWLASQSPDQLQQLNHQATEHFYRRGITFTVYSDASNTERVIPFDIIPRIRLISKVIFCSTPRYITPQSTHTADQIDALNYDSAPVKWQIA
jgi:uncharacterized circularly permuted ATP-grasp superfamily protein